MGDCLSLRDLDLPLVTEGPTSDRRTSRMVSNLPRHLKSADRRSYEFRSNTIGTALADSGVYDCVATAFLIEAFEIGDDLPRDDRNGRRRL